MKTVKRPDFRRSQASSGISQLPVEEDCIEAKSFFPMNDPEHSEKVPSSSD